jgi:hypothetical protein
MSGAARNSVGTALFFSLPQQSLQGLFRQPLGNLDTSPCQADKTLDDTGNWTETDITVGYNRASGPVTAGVGYIYYALSALQPGGRDLPDSQEVYVSLGMNTLLTPTLTVYKEISHYKQWYFLLGMSHAFALNDKVTLKLAATASYLKSGDSDDYPEIGSDYQPRVMNTTIFMMGY